MTLIQEIWETEAKLEVVDTGIHDEEARIVIKNSGDKIGLITSVILNGIEHKSFYASHVVGLREKQKAQYEYVPAGYCPGNGYYEIKVRDVAKPISTITLYTDVGRYPRATAFPAPVFESISSS
uniref:Uncharacterized protein n=1 Tax=Candidatus Kentrum sp. LPFa TaxID=2126335 RepID=A0A450Y5R3_9GAMM|nr:MAG: hypothetical protein BECKLPF1236A_GA0070988_107481 [Candidatus Kentron sp. LPFa]VFK36871.1 MAG: hypothetical protein BECKLPF1236C_GA0070990_107131 [Candidatus Kentron sp. LPFa]